MNKIYLLVSSAYTRFFRIRTYKKNIFYISILLLVLISSTKGSDVSIMPVEPAIATATPTPTPEIIVTAGNPVPAPSPLTITADSSYVQVGIPKSITFSVTRECGTEGEVCIAVYPPPMVPASGVYVYLGGVATGSGYTDSNGYVILTVNANIAGTIYVTATKSGYSDAGMTIVAEMPPTPPPENKFRVGPTVRIRPLNDIISDSQDGLVELYMDNPSLNSVILNVDLRISVPSGVQVYGQGFGEAGAAGMVYGTFEVPPGSARTISITFKTINTVGFSAQFSGMYWPGDNKDAYQPISLTHPFKVNRCPLVTPPYCPNGNIISQGKDANGCDKPSICVTPTITITPTISTPKPITQKFRVGPTVNLRPVKDDIRESEDGLIELYIDNPSLNDVVMNVDIRITVPSGISVHGQGFADAGSAGVIYGTFQIDPGISRTVQMSIKPEKEGEFLIKFGGLYWPGNNKDAFQPISLTHYIRVKEDISKVEILPTSTPYPPSESFDIFKWFSDIFNRIYRIFTNS